MQFDYLSYQWLHRARPSWHRTHHLALLRKYNATTTQILTLSSILDHACHIYAHSNPASPSLHTTTSATILRSLSDTSTFHTQSHFLTIHERATISTSDFMRSNSSFLQGVHGPPRMARRLFTFLRTHTFTSNHSISLDTQCPFASGLGFFRN